MLAENENRLIKNSDLVYIGILVVIALVVGVYLIATTVLISKDGAFYIEQAQKLVINPIKTINRHPPGYPLLILITYKLVTLFSNNSSIQTWIYAAQSVTLFCQVLALIPLYLTGKLLVGSRNSFLAILILILLPFPSNSVCDVVREWPYMLFLATGFFLLLWSIRNEKWWVFGIVGLSSGVGYTIRPESAQLIAYGFLWAVINIFKPNLWKVTRRQNLLALSLLVIGFAIPAVPYMKCTGKIIPKKVNYIMKSFSFEDAPGKRDIPIPNIISSNCNTAEIMPFNVLKAFAEIINTIGENLMWFFMPALMIGLYCNFRGNIKFEERFLIISFILVNVTVIIIHYICIQLHVSQRWTLPLITFTIFYIPIGLQAIGNWLDIKLSNLRQKPEIKKKQFSWFVFLFLIGIGICMPKLLRPIRMDKQGYRDASKWLKENTAPADIIAVPDRRLSLYAERKGLRYDKKIPKQAKYIIKILEDEEPNFTIPVSKIYWVWTNQKEQKKRIVIYKVL